MSLLELGTRVRLLGTHLLGIVVDTSPSTLDFAPTSIYKMYTVALDDKDALQGTDIKVYSRVQLEILDMCTKEELLLHSCEAVRKIAQ